MTDDVQARLTEALLREGRCPWYWRQSDGMWLVCTLDESHRPSDREHEHVELSEWLAPVVRDLMRQAAADALKAAGAEYRTNIAVRGDAMWLDDRADALTVEPQP